MLETMIDDNDRHPIIINDVAYVTSKWLLVKFDSIHHFETVVCRHYRKEIRFIFKFDDYGYNMNLLIL